MDRTKLMKGVRRVVVKVGTGVLTQGEGRYDGAVFQALAAECSTLLSQGREVVVVSSGAIGLGVKQLGLPARPKKMDGLQACAAAGQLELMRLWGEAFAPHGRVVAQVLLTHADLADRKRFLNARRALSQLVAHGAVPIINENDTVSVDEIAFGDNDSLSAQVANLVGADLLVMASVAPALLDAEGQRVAEVHCDDRSAERFIRQDKSSGGTGGMVTKVKAARAAASFGCAAVIAAGKQPGILASVLAGEDVGTLFWPATARLASRAHWIAHTLRARGALVLDAGAVEAVVERNHSLLPSGVTEVRGSFEQGDAVELLAPDGTAVARGLAAYSAKELEAIRGLRARDIHRVLGYHLGDEAVHRDDLVVLEPVR